MTVASQSPALPGLLNAIESMEIARGDLLGAAVLVADAAACIFGAAASDASLPVRDWARLQPASPQACAWVFAALSNLLEMDAMHVASSVHPGTVVVPAALAVALARGSTIDAFVRAVLRGTEAAIRLGRATGGRHRQLYQSTSTCAGLGAALACAQLMGLDRERQMDAMANVTSTAGGLWAFVDEDTHTKQWHAGHAAQAAVACAELSSCGIKGPRDILHSRRGFLAVLCPDAQPQELVREVERWQVHDIAYKPWPCPRPTHAAITASLHAREGLGTARIQGVRLDTFGMAVDLCNRPQPATPHEARFSLQHCVAAALAGSTASIDFDSFGPEAIASSRGLAGLVSVHACADMTAAYPARSRARVTVELADGRHIVADTEHALGDPELPLDVAAVRLKHAALVRDPDARKAVAAAGLLDLQALSQLGRAFQSSGLRVPRIHAPMETP